MKVLVNGVGNLGTTLLQVLTAHWDLLDADTVFAHKHTLRSRDLPQLQRLKNLGVILVGDDYPAQADIASVAHEIDYVFDAARPGEGRLRKPGYDDLPNLLGASAQGSERGFGTPYVLGHGMDASLSRHVSVPSCTTHAALAVLRTITGGDLDRARAADFVVASPGDPAVHGHLDDVHGTRAAVDAEELLAVLGRRLPIQSDELSLPEEFLHIVRFSVRLDQSPGLEQVRDRIDRSAYVCRTEHTDTAAVFDIGRRFGLGGRLFQQVIFSDSSLMVKDQVVSGWAFVPREGNTVLSTMSAYLQRTRGLCEASRRIEGLAESLLLGAL